MKTLRVLLPSTSQEGTYTVTGFAYDGLESLYANLQVVIADVPCTMPVVTITGAATIIGIQPTNFRSFVTKLDATTQLECNKTVSVM